ncbi:hypothetical protein D9M73_137780 [compost metagenome]
MRQIQTRSDRQRENRDGQREQGDRGNCQRGLGMGLEIGLLLARQRHCGIDQRAVCGIGFRQTRIAAGELGTVARAGGGNHMIGLCPKPLGGRIGIARQGVHQRRVERRSLPIRVPLVIGLAQRRQPRRAHIDLVGMVGEQGRLEKRLEHIFGRRQDVGDIIRFRLDLFTDRAPNPDQIDAVCGDHDGQQHGDRDQGRADAKALGNGHEGMTFQRKSDAASL